MNEVNPNPLPGGGKTLNCKQINLDSPIRIKTTHNEYLSCSPDQGQQFLGLGFWIWRLKKFFETREVASQGKFSQLS